MSTDCSYCNPELGSLTEVPICTCLEPCGDRDCPGYIRKVRAVIRMGTCPQDGGHLSLDGLCEDCGCTWTAPVDTVTVAVKEPTT